MSYEVTSQIALPIGPIGLNFILHVILAFKQTPVEAIFFSFPIFLHVIVLLVIIKVQCVRVFWSLKFVNLV